MTKDIYGEAGLQGSKEGQVLVNPFECPGLNPQGVAPLLTSVDAGPEHQSLGTFMAGLRAKGRLHWTREEEGNSIARGGSNAKKQLIRKA